MCLFKITIPVLVWFESHFSFGYNDSYLTGTPKIYLYETLQLIKQIKEALHLLFYKSKLVLSAQKYRFHSHPGLSQPSLTNTDGSLLQQFETQRAVRWLRCKGLHV